MIVSVIVVMVLFIQIGYGQQNQQAVVQQNAAVISDYPTMHKQ